MARAHLLGIDDGPFQKYEGGGTAPLVAVMMEGADLVEAVAVSRFPVDGGDVTQYLLDWVGDLRMRPALQAVCFGGITIAGLGVIDVSLLAERLGVPVLVINRRPPADEPLVAALRSAGLDERIALVERSPRAFPVGERLHVAQAGASPERAAELVLGAVRKSDLPEPLRIAHMVARAIVTGESRGRP